MTKQKTAFLSRKSQGLLPADLSVLRTAALELSQEIDINDDMRLADAVAEFRASVYDERETRSAEKISAKLATLCSDEMIKVSTKRALSAGHYNTRVELFRRLKRISDEYETDVLVV